MESQHDTMGAQRASQLASSTRSILAVAVPLIFAALVYYPITGNYFWGDDFVNLYLMRNLPGPDYILRPRGDHLLITSNLAFYLTAGAFGHHPAPYFWIVLATHLANVLLLFWLIRGLTNSRLIACFGATLWGLSPAHAATLGWYSVYGHVLVGTFLLLLLHGLAGRRSASSPHPLTPFLWAILVMAAATSFGVGIGVAMVMPVAAVLIVRDGTARWRAFVSFLIVAVAVLVLYSVLHQQYVNPRRQLVDLSSSLSSIRLFWDRGFELTWRIVRFGVSSLVLGPLSRGMNPTARTIAAVSVAAVIAAGLADAPWQRRRIGLVVLLVSLACYGIVAAGRGAFFEPGQDGLAQAGRYQYAGQIGLTIALCLALTSLARRLSLHPALGRGLFLVWLIFLAGSNLWLGAGIRDYPATRRETASALRSIQQAIDAATPGSNVIIPNRPLRTVGLVGRAQWLLPGWAALFVVFYPDNIVTGKHVYFTMTDARALRAAKDGRRSATLIVSPDQARALAGETR